MLGIVAGAACASAASFLVILLYGRSPELLLWVPALLLMAFAAVGVLGGWRSKSARRRLADGLVALIVIAAAAVLTASRDGRLQTTVVSARTADAALDGFVPIRGGMLHYHQSAPADSPLPVLLVVHGGPGSGSAGLRAAIGEQLEPHFRTIFFDQRGTGRSGPASGYAVDDYVDDMERLRLALGVDVWSIAGVSWGAALANEYTRLHPDHVRAVATWGGLVNSQAMTRSMLLELRSLYAGRGDARGESWAVALASQREPYSRLQTLRVMNAVNRARLKTTLSRQREIDEVLAARQRAVREWGYTRNQVGEALWPTLATFMESALEKYDFEPHLHEVIVPYLFLVGDHDPLLAHVDVERQASRMPKAVVRRIGGSGHTLDRPDAVAAALIAFLEPAAR